MVFPDNHTTGTHVNLSGMVMARYAPNKDNGQKLMEFLVSKEAQKIYANLNTNTLSEPILYPRRFFNHGAYRIQTKPMRLILLPTDKASRLVDIVGFDR